MKKAVCCFLVMLSAVLPVTLARALDSSLDLSFSQSTVRSAVLTTNGLQYVPSRSYQLSDSLMISQNLGDLWTLSGSISGSQTFMTNLGLALLPQTLAFQVGVVFIPWDFLTLSAEYNNTSVNTFSIMGFYTEHEPVLSVTYAPVFPVDWFMFSTGVSASFYYINIGFATRQGWGFIWNVIPQFSITAWNLDFSLPTSLSFDTTGYKGATNAGFNNVTPNLSVTYTAWDSVTFNLTIGYSISLSPDQVTRVESSYPFIQLGLGFLITGSEISEPDDPDSDGDSGTVEETE